MCSFLEIIVIINMYTFLKTIKQVEYHEVDILHLRFKKKNCKYNKHSQEKLQL